MINYISHYWLLNKNYTHACTPTVGDCRDKLLSGGKSGARCSSRNNEKRFLSQPSFLPPSHTDTRPPPSHHPVSLFHLLSFLQQTWPRNQTVQPFLCRMTFRRRASLGWRSALPSAVPLGRSIRSWTAAGPSAPSWSFSRTGLQTCG